MEVLELENNRGGIKISFEGHLYVKKRTHADGKIRWQPFCSFPFIQIILLQFDVSSS